MSLFEFWGFIDFEKFLNIGKVGLLVIIVCDVSYVNFLIWNVSYVLFLGGKVKEEIKFVNGSFLKFGLRYCKFKVLLFLVNNCKLFEKKI